MSDNYKLFQSIIDPQIDLQVQNSNISINPEQKEKVCAAVSLLWLYDFRRIIGKDIDQDKYYPQIIRNVSEAISKNLPVKLIQFTCPPRKARLYDLTSDNFESYLDVETEKFAIEDNLPFLNSIVEDFNKINVDVDIEIFLADSSVYWMSLGRGWNPNFTITEEELLSKLKPRYEELYSKIQKKLQSEPQFDSSRIKITPYSIFESQIAAITKQSYQDRFDSVRDKVLVDIANSQEVRRRILFNGVRTDLIQQGNPKDKALVLARDLVKLVNPDELLNLDAIIKQIGEITNNPETNNPEARTKNIDIAELGITWEIEYRLNGIDFELMRPGVIMIQTEKQALTKNQLYNQDRTTLMPIISREI